MARDKRHTEFGGGPGWPARREDGSAVPLKPSQRRAITAMQMKRDLPDYTAPRIVTESNGAGTIKSAPLASDVERLKDLDARTNGYSKEFGPGDNGSGETVG